MAQSPYLILASSAATIVACETQAPHVAGPTRAPTPSVSAAPRVAQPPPPCPKGKPFEADAGCIYEATGTPPLGAGAPIVAIAATRLDQDGGAAQVADFWIETRRVTVEGYGLCVAAGRCQPVDSKCLADVREPADDVVCVRWSDARDYCEWKGRRLPTSNEWLVAAKGHPGNGMLGLGGGYSEWLGSYFCSPEIGGCGRARATTVYNDPMRLGRLQPVYAVADVGFRCAWSMQPPQSTEEPPERVPQAPSSPGRIWCENTTCEAATEVCCHNARDGLGRCESKQNPSCRDTDVWARCDEQADCPQGQVCVPYWGCSGGCPAERVCQAPPGESGEEVCNPGGTCREGFRCAVLPGDVEGSCRWNDPGASCGARRCSGKTPICCWNADARKGTCSEGPCPRSETPFRCSGPRDCGGSTCGQLQYLGNPEVDPDHVGYSCTGLNHMVQAALCNTVKDCPRHPPTGSVPVGCRHYAGLPAGVKACDYGFQP